MYSLRQKYHRWPIHIFFTYIDSSAYFALKMIHLTCDSKESHYHFNKNLAYELCLPLVKKRVQLPTLCGSVKEAIKIMEVKIPLKDYQAPAAQNKNKKQGHCIPVLTRMTKKQKLPAPCVLAIYVQMLCIEKLCFLPWYFVNTSPVNKLTCVYSQYFLLFL